MKPVSAAKDFLTNCYTREGITPFLRKMEEDYLSSKRPFSILIMDVDHFKLFNDKYGHLTGDEVLKYFSSSMRLDLEDEENMPFRFGGDEFIMVFPNKTAVEAHRLATRLRKNIRTRSCLIKGRQVRVTFSGGIAGYPTDASSIEDILDKADKALYYSKNHGRSRITKYSDLGHKELFQTLVILLLLGLVGGGLYAYRESLSAGIGRVESAVLDFIPKQQAHQEAPEPAASVPAPEPAGEGKAPIKPAIPGPSKIYLEAGRQITGVIKAEDEDFLTVEVALNQGKGLLQIKKSQVARIEKV